MIRNSPTTTSGMPSSDGCSAIFSPKRKSTRLASEPKATVTAAPSCGTLDLIRGSRRPFLISAWDGSNITAHAACGCKPLFAPSLRKPKASDSTCLCRSAGTRTAQHCGESLAQRHQRPPRCSRTGRANLPEFPTKRRLVFCPPGERPSRHPRHRAERPTLAEEARSGQGHRLAEPRKIKHRPRFHGCP